MLHRLLLALLFTFAASAPTIQSCLCSLSTLAFLIVHLVLQPMQGTDAQAFQTCLLSSLLVVSLSRDFQASTLELASPTMVPGATDFFAVMTLLFGYIVPVLGVLMCYRGYLLLVGACFGRLCTNVLCRWQIGCSLECVRRSQPSSAEQDHTMQNEHA